MAGAQMGMKPNGAESTFPQVSLANALVDAD